jgi:hypothetical protein
LQPPVSPRDDDGHVLGHRRMQMRAPRSGSHGRFRNTAVPRRLSALDGCGVHAIKRAVCHREESNPPAFVACKTRTIVCIGLFSRGSGARPCKRCAPR